VEKRYDEDYKNLVQIFQSLHLDNMKSLRALISHKDDIQPLVVGTTKVKVRIFPTYISLVFCISLASYFFNFEKPDFIFLI
jgi:hypothetical protein